ncbi:hypothetical protein G4B88_019823 [Cannabis sativa]|uniref:Uncharacterized protein n=1 Tax=Cannabis sativa TaxID=3483 RepID=A0A7J6HS38_CANSA|nr:hypothetical protein G4B88_019823 [Cannabis sativa]
MGGDRSVRAALVTLFIFAIVSIPLTTSEAARVVYLVHAYLYDDEFGIRLPYVPLVCAAVHLDLGRVVRNVVLVKSLIRPKAFHDHLTSPKAKYVDE